MPEHFSQILFNINSAIFVGMIYYAFARVFKAATKKIWIVLAFATYAVISTQLFFVFENNPWINVAFTVVALLIFTFLFSGNPSAKLVFGLLVYTTIIMAEGLSYFSLNFAYLEVPPEYMHSIGRTIANFILLPLLLINVLVFRKFINKKAGHKHFRVPARYTVSVLVILAVVLLANILFMFIVFGTIQTDITIMLIAQSIVLIIMLLITWLYNTMLEHLENIEKSRVKDQMLERWEVQYKAVMSSQRALAELKHDLRFHLLTIAGHLKKDEKTKALEYIANKVGSFDYIIATDNMPIDTILNYYQQRVRETLNIDLETELIIPPDMTLDTTNVVMILGNALENAVEACGHVDRPERYIRVKAIVTAQNELMITITNPYAIEPIVDKEGNLLTIKSDKDNHGLGLASAREILPEEIGHVHIDYSDNVFQFMLFLYDVREEDQANVAN